jgi:hypothetical protein
VVILRKEEWMEETNREQRENVLWLYRFLYYLNFSKRCNIIGKQVKKKM